MMKKLLLSGVAMVVASTVVAQVSDTPVFEHETRCTLDVAPPEICDGNLPQIVYTNENEIVVLDDNFKEIKRFSFETQEVKPVETDYRALPIFATDKEEYPVAEGTKFTVGTALSYIQENLNNNIKVEEHGTETWFVCEYYDSWRYEENFPRVYYSLKSDGSLWYTYILYKEITAYSDKWIQIHEPTVYEYTSYPGNTYLNINGREIDGSLTATQKLFNDDDAYEYIVPIFTYKTAEYYEGACINGMYEYKTAEVGDFVTGFKIMNDKGETLQTFNSSWHRMYAFILGENIYFTPDSEKYYRVNKSGSSTLAEVSMPSGVSISPRVAQNSTPVNITATESDSDRTIKVISANGSIMTTTKIPAGSTSATINTSRFRSGTYIVLVSEGDKMVENCKIIIR
ncbi:T9SS type A sorting domain-containing protein [Barnesiella sp. WM24]|uniref:T9SS type A sorting domain-containing protein n=1 Tax=Barnesiella sp. WM24 TaxID=2558278 RepID=UPI001071644C|nr:T9SS type A sorting domain-containing protein [Barnesiella sp. WM24]TFU93131.1 T9SS type A sorting domain-containing protein [Barnesiella sp. WM24]